MIASSTTSRRAPVTVALLTVGWVLVVLALLALCFAIAMADWSDHHSNSGARSGELARQAASVVLVLAAVLGAGPLVIAVVAMRNGLVRTGVVYLVLAVGLGAAALVLAAWALRTLVPAGPLAPPPAPTICQEHSGGDANCPGG